MKLKNLLTKDIALYNPKSVREAMTGVSPASELLSLMAAPEFKKYKDQLSDVIEDADFMKIDKLYTALYEELKKHE